MYDGNLQIKVQHLPINLDDFDDDSHAWGKLELSMLMGDGRVENLLIVEWHIRHFIDWFINGFSHVAYQVLWEAETNETVAQAVSRIRAEIQDAPYEIRSKLQDFVQNHSLNYGFSRMSVPSIFLAFRGQGELGEISAELINYPKKTPYLGQVWYKEGSWSYSFDMHSFIDHTQRTFEKFLEDWEYVGNLATQELLNKLRATRRPLEQHIIMSLSETDPERRRMLRLLPKERAYEYLKATTGQDFGYDVARWQAWIDVHGLGSSKKNK